MRRRVVELPVLAVLVGLLVVGACATNEPRAAPHTATPAASSSAAPSPSQAASVAPDGDAGTALASRPTVSESSPAPQVLPPRPVEPWSQDRVCARDADCVVLPDSCMGPPPCDAAWRPVANKAAAEKAAAAPKLCPPADWPPCPPQPIPPHRVGDPPEQIPVEGYIGDRAVCDHGQCSIR